MERDGRDEQCRRFGLRLVSVRRRLALTQDELSADSGMSRGYLSGVETGKRNLGLWNICKLADAMRVLPLELLDFDGVTDGGWGPGEPAPAYLASEALASSGPVEFKELQGDTPRLRTLEADPPGRARQAE